MLKHNTLVLTLAAVEKIESKLLQKLNTFGEINKPFEAPLKPLKWLRDPCIEIDNGDIPVLDKKDYPNYPNPN